MSRKRSCELGITYIEKLLQREICQNRGQRTALPGLDYPSSSAQDTPRDDGRSTRPLHTRGPESCSGTERSGYAPESRLGTDRSAAGHRLGHLRSRLREIPPYDHQTQLHSRLREVSPYTHPAHLCLDRQIRAAFRYFQMLSACHQVKASLLFAHQTFQADPRLIPRGCRTRRASLRTGSTLRTVSNLRSVTRLNQAPRRDNQADHQAVSLLALKIRPLVAMPQLRFPVRLVHCHIHLPHANTSLLTRTILNPASTAAHPATTIVHSAITVARPARMIVYPTIMVTVTSHPVLEASHP
jgi:hypothetical protein